MILNKKRKSYVYHLLAMRIQNVCSRATRYRILLSSVVSSRCNRGTVVYSTKLLCMYNIYICIIYAIDLRALLHFFTWPRLLRSGSLSYKLQRLITRTHMHAKYTHAQIHTHTYTYTHIYVYIHRSTHQPFVTDYQIRTA